MTPETIAWIEDAVRRCADAQKMGVSLMLRINSEKMPEMMIACTSADALVIAALGQALAREYVLPTQSEEI